jgi:hypothetical protein
VGFSDCGLIGVGFSAFQFWQSGVPGKPASGLLGWNYPILAISASGKAARRKFAAPQTVIVSSGAARSRTIEIGEAHFMAFCLRLSARDPPPQDVLLRTKAEPQFERPVKSLSPPLFPVFRALIAVNFRLVFSSRSPVGRGSQLSLWISLANCHLLTAKFSMIFSCSHPEVLPEYRAFLR